ncbi:recombinase family protein [Streptomyces sp. SID12501]|uniref:Recombinase family protein n=1 Tax=Streptomyces sp. SID12501 TaxID=2706042 RepID=A0A6B3BYZ6_9ACTN|nr:recombinase family protein [Streptomyces sp. SID12501]NEC89605.1 recombinase family protein [Streptomyces sp. SID12501]
MPIVARPCHAAPAAVIVAKYARVSTLDQLDGFGLEDQDKVSNGWLGRHPEVTVYDSYVDEAVSGALESRPEMDRLVVDARQQHFNRILVPKVDRIGRTARAAYQWAWNMADLGIHFISVTEGIDTSTEEGWQQFMRYVTFSERDWRRIKERTVAGRELKISYGGWPGGPAPYGYRIEKDAKDVGGRRKRFSVLVTDVDESMVLAVAADLIIDQGMNLTEACEELNNRRLFARSGVRWSVANLRSRLYSETIHDGYVVYRKTDRGNGKNHTRRGDDGTPVHGDPVKIGVPPIFSVERAAQLMAALKRLGFQNGRRGNAVYPLTGRIHGLCGEVYTGAGRGTGRSYRCKGLLKDPSCREPHFEADDIEGAVRKELAMLLEAEGCPGGLAAERVGGLSGDKEKYEKRVSEFTTRIAEQEHLIEVRIPEYVRAGVDPAVLKASIAVLETELADFRKQRRFAQQWLEAYTDHERRAGNLVDIASSIEERLQKLTLGECKEVFDRFDLKVVPGDLAILGKPGGRCAVSDWHWTTGTKVPPDPDDEQWGKVLEVLRPYFTKRHFMSRYDIRLQLEGMLHRLRHGLSWCDMPLTWGPVDPIRERQLSWWQKGAWPEVMKILDADVTGVGAYRRPTLPQLTVTGRFRSGLLGEVRGAVAGDRDKQR